MAWRTVPTQLLYKFILDDLHDQTNMIVAIMKNNISVDLHNSLDHFNF